jgi:hypothetical protein
MDRADRDAMAAAGLPLGDVEPVASADDSRVLTRLRGVLRGLSALEDEWRAAPAPLRARLERVVHLKPDGTVAVYRLERYP